MKNAFKILLLAMCMVAGCSSPVVREERTETTTIEEKLSYDPPPVSFEGQADIDNDSIADVTVLSPHSAKDTVLKLQYVKPKAKGEKGTFKARYDPPPIDSAGTRKTTEKKESIVKPCTKDHTTFQSRVADLAGGFALCATITIILLTWYWINKRR